MFKEILKNKPTKNTRTAPKIGAGLVVHPGTPLNQTLLTRFARNAHSRRSRRVPRAKRSGASTAERRRRRRGEWVPRARENCVTYRDHAADNVTGHYRVPRDSRRAPLRER